jgi:hypothetical protein
MGEAYNESTGCVRIQGGRMGQLDRTGLFSPLGPQRMGLDYETWMHVLGAAHDHYSLMPYELAEIEECSMVHDEAIGTGGTGLNIGLGK